MESAERMPRARRWALSDLTRQFGCGGEKFSFIDRNRRAVAARELVGQVRKPSGDARFYRTVLVPTLAHEDQRTLDRLIFLIGAINGDHERQQQYDGGSPTERRLLEREPSPPPRFVGGLRKGLHERLVLAPYLI